MIRFRLAELIADKSFRERRVVTVLEISRATGVHRASLSKMANQPGANIGTEIIEKLCRYFGCQPGELMTFVEDEPDAPHQIATPAGHALKPPSRLDP